MFGQKVFPAKSYRTVEPLHINGACVADVILGSNSADQAGALFTSVSYELSFLLKRSMSDGSQRNVQNRSYRLTTWIAKSDVTYDPRHTLKLGNIF